MNCPFDKYRSETLFWDDKSFKVYHPEIMSYVVNNSPIIRKTITWDNQSYLINNPDNYSYYTRQTYDAYVGCNTFQIWFRYRLYTCVSNSRRWGNWTNWAMLPHILTNPKPSIIVSDGGQSSCGGVSYNLNRYQIKVTHSGTSCVYPGSENLYGLYQAFDANFEFSVISTTTVPTPKLIVIIDGGITHEFPIIDTGSIDVITENIPNKKIIVNGNEYDLSDESSIELLCTDPIPQCPTGSIECDCGDVIWCLSPTKGGYKIIKCINK